MQISKITAQITALSVALGGCVSVILTQPNSSPDLSKQQQFDQSHQWKLLFLKDQAGINFKYV
jgi:hypothetical protein